MRVEQLIGNYTNNQRKAQPGFSKLRSLRNGKPLKGAVLDVVCLSADQAEGDLGWFSAYVHQLPDDIVAEKIRQIFHRQPSDTGQSDDALIEKLLFEVL